LITLVLGVLIGIGYLGPGAIGPQAEGGSPQAEKIKTLYLITLGIGFVVFMIVEGTLIWALVRDRYRRGAPAPRQVRGNTRLELGWTIGATVILIVLAAITFAMLPGIREPAASDPGALAQTRGVALATTDQPPPPDGKGLTIRVVGQQYIWRHDYPGGVYSFYEMVVPTNTTILLDITSTDVIHAYWIPALFGKADAVPGHVNHTWFKVREPGVYYGNCTELCGENHAQMVQQVRAVPPDEYRAWHAQQQQGIRESAAYLSLSRRLREGESNEASQQGEAQGENER
ncbi:MAG: cytochrome c oxidase subunit II, partial [Chloroflexota bacterium]|nr:cytochrome c oxidase subunit II [Chloroflexota bacterium]